MPNTTNPLKVLQISAPGWDDALLASTLARVENGAEIRQAGSAPGLRTAIGEQQWDVALFVAGVSISLPTALRILEERIPDLPLIAILPEADGQAALRALKGGARDVIDLAHLELLLPAIDREVRQAGHRADHRVALEMLKESEDRFRAIASNLPGMLFQLRREPGGEYRFLYVSEGCQKLFGFKQHEFIASSRRFFDAFDADEKRRLEDALRGSADNGTLLNWEGRTKGRSRPKWINLRSTPNRLESGSVEWQGLATNITHSKDIESELRSSRAQLAELSSHMEAVKEEERERIARDIHDELGSILVRLKIEVALLAAKLPESAASLREKAMSIEELLDQAMGTASRVARELRPGILKEFGFAAAIECQAEDFSQRSGIVCRMQSDDEAIEPDAETSLALFRIAQEALTNVAKHAHASLVVLRLRRERGNIVLEIRDNGRGISAADMVKPKSFGLRGIRERISSLGGDFNIDSGEQGGTHLVLRVPEQAGSEPPREEETQGRLF